MDLEIKKPQVEVLPPKIEREDILSFENALSERKDVLVHVLGKGEESDLAPVKHHFAPGVYSREMFIPKGTVIVSKIHRHAHHSFLMKGEITVISEYGGIQRLKAPLVILSTPGAKRIGFAHEDTIWVTVHPTKKTDLLEIEDEVIAESYDDLELSEQEKIELKKTHEENFVKLVEILNESEV